MPEKKDISISKELKQVVKQTKENTKLLQHVIKHMATKEDLTNEIGSVRDEMANGFAGVRADIAKIRTEIMEIRTELIDIRKRLDNLEEIVKDHSHYTKEIDHAFVRIAVIEKQLGIKTN